MQKAKQISFSLACIHLYNVLLVTVIVPTLVSVYFNSQVCADFLAISGETNSANSNVIAIL